MSEALKEIMKSTRPLKFLRVKQLFLEDMSLRCLSVRGIPQQIC